MSSLANRLTRLEQRRAASAVDGGLDPSERDAQVDDAAAWDRVRAIAQAVGDDLTPFLTRWVRLSSAEARAQALRSLTDRELDLVMVAVGGVVPRWCAAIGPEEQQALAALCAAGPTPLIPTEARPDA